LPVHHGKAVDKVDGGITVTIPVENADAGTVEVLENADGTETIIRKSYAKDGSVTTPLDGSATVKIIDNSKAFEDVKPRRLVRMRSTSQAVTSCSSEQTPACSVRTTP
jgi:hypothetical protein